METDEREATKQKAIGIVKEEYEKQINYTDKQAILGVKIRLEAEL